MPRIYSTPMQDAVEDCIQHNGTMTRLELEAALGFDENQVSGALRGLRNRKKIHIAKYTRQDGKAGRFTPHYAIGDLPDAEMMRQLTPRQRNIRYRERNRARINAANMARRGRTYNIWKGLMT